MISPKALSLTLKTNIACVSASTCLVGILALSIGMLTSAAANADHIVGDSRTEQVKLADLDLSNADGQQLAQARLQEVARTLCSRTVDELDLGHHEHYLKCVESTVAKANQRLQALVNQRSATRLARADVK